MNLNLEKVWEVMNILSNKQSDLSQLKDIYVNFMGHSSEYNEMSFESFLDYYSFKVDKDEIVVFNNDGVAWEDYNNEDFSYIPSVILSFSAEKLGKWIETKIRLELTKQEENKISEKEELKRNIERLTKQLNNLQNG